ncbi:MAG: lipid-binding SYLF domain-containing protein [Bryobacteraceae bacterium]|nr:lipid-binding SYLF domain-containing protein [Bryobacteraceae bacterium]
MTSFRIIVSMLAASALAAAEAGYFKRLSAAEQTLNEAMTMSDGAIPGDLLNRAECVVIVPGMKKGAFIFGGKYGRGFLSCRKTSGVGWTGPGAVRLEGFNFGLQAGGQETDVLLLIMNERGMNRLLTSRFTVGADASAAAGPVGRTLSAQTDAFMSAEILTYSRARGAFAGVSLEGATLRQDLEVNRRMYGKSYSNRDIVSKNLDPPDAAQPLIALLNKYSGRKGK